MVRSRARRVVVVGLAALMLAGGCSGRSDPIGFEEARTTLEGYVSAVASGNIDDAMSQRCTAARVKDADRELFTAQAARLSAGVGGIRVAAARLVDPPSGLKPLASIKDPIEVAYQLSIRGAGVVRAELHTVVGREGGRPRLCGFSTAEAANLHASLAGQTQDLGSTSRDPQQLMPSSAGPGYRQVDDSGRGAAKSGVTGSWSRAWQVGEYGGARVTAWRYGSAAQAAAGAEELLQRVASDAVEQFSIATVAGAVGVRYLGFAWLWVQPSTEGPFIDEVVMQYSDRVVAVSASNLPGGSAHDVVAQLAGEVARLARP